MYDPYQYPSLPPTLEQEWQETAPEPPDRLDPLLEELLRFMVLFCFGIALTLLARWFPILRPFYWLLSITGIGALLLFGGYLQRNTRLLALAIALMVTVFAGHWDLISHASTQGVQQLDQVIEHGNTQP